MADLHKRHALDHVVVALFENRSFDNVLGRLYGPGDAKSFAGVLDKDLSNPIPEWAEHGADRKVVPYGVTTDMDSPNPDSGEEYFHTKTQLFNTMDGHNRLKIGEGATEPWNAPPSGATPTMDGFVTDYISTFTGEVGRQPTYDEYAQIMTGYTPEQLPVLSAIARDFGVFDHWFSEVPSQTFMNEYRHTSLIATLRKVWGLGQAFTRRDTSSRTFDQVFALDKPRDPERWVAVEAQAVPDWTIDVQTAGGALSTLGKAIGPDIIDLAKQMGMALPSELTGADPEFTPELLIQFLRDVCRHLFPALSPTAERR